MTRVSDFTKHPSVLKVKQRLKEQTQGESNRTQRSLFAPAQRLQQIPPYLFTILDQLKAQAKSQGTDVIDLGMGNPDLPPPAHVLEKMKERVMDAENHGYSRPNGEAERKVREAIATWYKRKFNVTLDATSEVLPLIGSKEGISHLSLAFLDHDDVALVPNPTYPPHFNGITLAGGTLHNIPIDEAGGYLPDLKSLKPAVVKKAKMLFISYPHNPTTAVASRAFFKDVVEWARKHSVMVVHDFAYSDFIYEGERAPSILEIPGASEVAVEFHTLSKSYCLPGMRFGFTVGNRDVLASLSKIKNYIDFGIFRVVQWAAVDALLGPQDFVTQTISTYGRRRDLFVPLLNKAGWPIPMPKGTFYVWARIPKAFSGLTSLEFATLLMQEAGVVAAPGSGFGEYGEGFLRFALVEPDARLHDAAKRIERVLALAG